MFSRDFGSKEDYLQSVNGKNSASYYSRKAKKRNYTFQEIDPNEFLNDIFEINTSSLSRQGRQMDKSYLQKKERYEEKSYIKRYGILDEEKKQLDNIPST